jgi:hypothetical protein
MHTLFVVTGGIALLGLMRVGAYLMGDDVPASLISASLYFIPIWFSISVLNMWMGVSKAGYSIADELPFLLINFTVPTFVALYASWKLN